MIIILVSILIGLVLGTVACNLPAQTTRSAEAQDTSTAMQLENEFTRVAEQVLPAVVRIDVESTAGGGTPGGGTEQIPEQFREFFRQFPWFNMPEGGEGQPQMPMPQRQGVGSGWIYSADGYIVTNAHVVSDATRVTVVLHDRGEVTQEVAATAVGTDPRTDLAVLKIDVNRELPFLRIGSSDDLKVASWVMAVGAPLQLEQTVTVGVVSAKGRIIEPDPSMPYLRLGDIIQTDASINPGNSGGPLVNLRGEVVGINVAYAAPGRVGNIGIGFAIAASTAGNIVPRLIAGQTIERGWLGVQIEELNQNLRQFYGVEYGIRIAGVTEDGPAADSELQVDDIVIAVDGDPVRSTWDLQQAVSQQPPGSTVTMTVVRNQQERTVEVTLGTMPAQYSGLPEEPTPTETPAQEWPLGIGVMPISELTPAIGQRLGIECSQGAIIGLAIREGIVVTDVGAASPASGRVQVGDVVSKVNGTQITSVEQYREQMNAALGDDRAFVVLHLTRAIEGEAVTRVVDIEKP